MVYAGRVCSCPNVGLLNVWDMVCPAAAGTWLRLTSTQGCVQMTLAATAVNSMLDALHEATAPEAEQGV